MRKKTAIIAGHSITAPGAIAYDKTTEHDYTFDLQQRIVKLHTDSAMYNGSSMLPATDHEGLSLRSVINLINANNSLKRAIDIHFNYNHPTASGTEVIVHPRTSEDNKQFASEMVVGISEILRIPHRRREPGRDYIFPSETPRGTLAIIEQTTIPVVLIEVCFLNKIDLPVYIQKRDDIAHYITKLSQE